MPGIPPLGATVDLDDTLFAQREYLHGAWQQVAAAAARHGLPQRALLAALEDIAAQGSDQGRIIDRALERCGTAASPEVTSDLVAAFRGHRPGSLPAYPGVRKALRQLRDVIPVACVTDGDPAVQRAKLSALGLDDAFDAIVISDELGREFRKPHAVPFLCALHALRVLAADAVHIGDRPEKDIVGPQRLGMGAIRVHTGEYAAEPDGNPPADLSVDDAVTAMAAIRDAVSHGHGIGECHGAVSSSAAE